MVARLTQDCPGIQVEGRQANVGKVGKVGWSDGGNNGSAKAPACLK